MCSPIFKLFKNKIYGELATVVKTEIMEEEKEVVAAMAVETEIVEEMATAVGKEEMVVAATATVAAVMKTNIVFLALK